MAKTWETLRAEFHKTLKTVENYNDEVETRIQTGFDKLTEYLASEDELSLSSYFCLKGRIKDAWDNINRGASINDQLSDYWVNGYF